MTEPTDGSPHAEPVGSLAEEAARLFRALQDQQRPVGEDDPHTCPHGWCPVCGLVDFVRDNPELVTKAASSAVEFFGTVREVADALFKQQQDPS